MPDRYLDSSPTASAMRSVTSRSPPPLRQISSSRESSIPLSPGPVLELRPSRDGKTLPERSLETPGPPGVSLGCSQDQASGLRFCAKASKQFVLSGLGFSCAMKASAWLPSSPPFSSRPSSSRPSGTSCGVTPSGSRPLPRSRSTPAHAPAAGRRGEAAGGERPPGNAPLWAPDAARARHSSPANASLPTPLPRRAISRVGVL
mmetsp:Transcript_21944/g.54047  ORF Transcript_21944/g.54047 Transcript_21944/m.54047 type:complete len:203 (-) Transcript_21944:11-619(-)